MNESLFDMFDRWLQGRIYVCIDGILARLSRIEELNVDDQITGLRRENNSLLTKLATETKNVNNLYQEVVTLNTRIADLEDRLVETASDEKLEGFKDRILALLDDDYDFRREFGDFVDNMIRNSDEMCSIADVRDFIRENVTIEVSRY